VQSELWQRLIVSNTPSEAQDTSRGRVRLGILSRSTRNTYFNRRVRKQWMSCLRRYKPSKLVEVVELHSVDGNDKFVLFFCGHRVWGKPPFPILSQRRSIIGTDLTWSVPSANSWCRSSCENPKTSLRYLEIALEHGTRSSGENQGPPCSEAAS